LGLNAGNQGMNIFGDTGTAVVRTLTPSEQQYQNAVNSGQASQFSPAYVDSGRRYVDPFDAPLP
jgi:hypothetical protein